MAITRTPADSGISMERLPFVLPDFTRVLWVSDTAKASWEARLRSIARAWLETEWRAVADGARRCAITVLSSDALVESSAAWMDCGLTSLPLEIQGSTDSYSSTPVAYERGRPFVFRSVVGRLDDLRAFRAAWLASDDSAIGELLGYPPCCTAFFRRVWVNERMVDTTWPMARATAGEINGARVLTMTGPPEANILWRWMGIRAVPHLPCRLDCAPTVETGTRLIAIGRQAGYRDEMDWLLEILRWPVEWSALHGIAEIRTPILKVSARTDATPVKYVVRREGDAYPAQGAKGLVFPYRTPPRPLLTTGVAFRRGLAHDLSGPATEPPWLATDNGFATVDAMRAAHAPIVRYALDVLGTSGAAILDLGCGNGALAATVAAADGVDPYGLDVDPIRIEHAGRLLPRGSGHFWAGNMFDSDAPWADGRRYRLAMLMPGRLLEGVEPERVAWLHDRLHRWCDAVLVYAYGDWLTRYGSLQGLVEAAGLKLQRSDGSVGLATVEDVTGAPRQEKHIDDQR